MSHQWIYGTWTLDDLVLPINLLHLLLIEFKRITNSITTFIIHLKNGKLADHIKLPQLTNGIKQIAPSSEKKLHGNGLIFTATTLEMMNFAPLLGLVKIGPMQCKSNTKQLANLPAYLMNQVLQKSKFLVRELVNFWNLYVQTMSCEVLVVPFIPKR